MITLNEIAYNIKNLAYGGKTSTENSISISQIKHWIHYHRAKLIADNIDKGITNNQTLYQALPLTLRNSTSNTAADYYEAWDAKDKDSSLSAPAIGAGFIENSPKFTGGKFTGEWLASSSMSFAYSSDSQAWQDGQQRDFYGREIKTSQVRGDFRNLGAHSFWTPRPLMLKNNSGIKKVNIERMIHFPDDPNTTSVNERTGGYQKKSITLYHKNSNDAEFGHHNKFTDNTKPCYSQYTARQNRETNSHGNYINIRNIQVSPNYHGGLNTPGNQKIFWKYRGGASMILEDPTEIDMMWDFWWVPKVDWDDATTPYPIAMEYVSDLIQRVIQIEMQMELKTVPDIVTDGLDDISKIKQSKGGAQVQR